MTTTPPEPPAGSILQTTKTSLGLAFDYTPYDNEIIIAINSVLANLNQLGIGPDGGMSIDGYDQTWDDFLVRVDETVADPRLAHCKSYMHLKVKMLFDPPSVGYLVDANAKMIEEAEWRIMVAQDDVIHPLPPPPPRVIPWYEDEDVVLDGGGP
jgi:hypothetical protein